MRTNWFIKLMLLFALCISLMLISVTAQVSRSIQRTTGVFHGCPPTGDDTGGDRVLNSLKNRDLPPDSFRQDSVSALILNTQNLIINIGNKKRQLWTTNALQEVSRFEDQGIVIEGFFRAIKLEGKESCNCHLQEDRDYHTWVSDNQNADKAHSIVAEISPRMIPAHRNWNQNVIERLINQHARVRVSGWLMWDQEHENEVGHSRGTLWEIHPIHKIEIFSGGVWRDLDEIH